MTTNVLFVCSLNRLRTPTAEEVFRNWPGVVTASAGTDSSAEEPVSAETLEWADLVVCMEDRHRARLNALFPQALKGRRMVVLGIPDRYGYMDPRLVAALKRKVPPLLRQGPIQPDVGPSSDSRQSRPR